jgi:hypothetical protein
MNPESYRTVDCPYCGEAIELLIDDSVGDQRYIEDCQVCCRPIEMRLHWSAGEWVLEVKRDDD